MYTRHYSTLIWLISCLVVQLIFLCFFFVCAPNARCNCFLYTFIYLFSLGLKWMMIFIFYKFENTQQCIFVYAVKFVRHGLKVFKINRLKIFNMSQVDLTWTQNSNLSSPFPGITLERSLICNYLIITWVWNILNARF